MTRESPPTPIPRSRPDPGTPLTDTHCHLFMAPLGEDVDAVLARARDVGVGRLVVPAYDRGSWEEVAALAYRDGVFAALGVHPWVAGQGVDRDALAAALSGCAAVAVGEVGLDSKVDAPDLDRQLAVLRPQLELAHDLRLPVILHCRGAFDALLDELARFDGALPGVVHAYSRGPQLARRLIEAGLHLGFGGAVTRPGAKRARRSVQVVAEARLLLETDAPSIGLHDVAPGHSEPWHVRRVADAVAELRGERLDVVAARTTALARELFGLP